MDAVKHLTRAGMGRCQGGFCGLTVLNQIAAHLGVPAHQGDQERNRFASNSSLTRNNKSRKGDANMSNIPERMMAAVLMGRNQLEVKEVPTPNPV
jgi:hypothetical protein